MNWKIDHVYGTLPEHYAYSEGRIWRIRRFRLGEKGPWSLFCDGQYLKVDGSLDDCKTAAEGGKAPSQEAPQTAQEAPKKQRYEILGRPLTAVLRRLGKAGWTHQEALSLCQSLDIDCSPHTVMIQVKAGAKGERGDPADLSYNEIRNLKRKIIQRRGK